MSALVMLVWKDAVPATVNAPVSEIPVVWLLVAIKSPSMVEAAKYNAAPGPAMIVTSPESSLVVIATAPVNVLVVVLVVMVLVVVLLVVVVLVMVVMLLLLGCWEQSVAAP